MQYLLTKEEYESLVPKKNFEDMEMRAFSLSKIIATLEKDKHGCQLLGADDYCTLCSAYEHCPSKFKVLPK